MPPEVTAPAPDKSRSKWELCIMRHGAAVPLGAEGYADDSKRPLTPDGKKKMQKISKGLRRLGFAADWIVSSPLLRAVETAEIVAATLGTSIPVDFSDTLSPGVPPEALLAFLAKHDNRKRILLVGHEPDLSELAARLTGAGRRANLAFKKGGCCLIRFDEFPPRSPARLVWWLTPRALRLMA